MGPATTNPVWKNCDGDVYAEAINERERGCTSWSTARSGSRTTTRRPRPTSRRSREKVDKTPYSLMSPVDDQKDPLMLSAWSTQRTVKSATDPRVAQVLREVRPGRADARAGCRLHRRGSPSGLGRARTQWEGGGLGHIEVIASGAVGLVLVVVGAVTSAASPTCGGLPGSEGPRSGLGRRGVRPGHGGPPSAGGGDGLHRPGPHGRRGRPQVRVRHHQHPGQSARHDARLAGDLGQAEGVDAAAHGVDGHGLDGPSGPRTVR